MILYLFRLVEGLGTISPWQGQNEDNEVLVLLYSHHRGMKLHPYILSFCMRELLSRALAAMYVYRSAHLGSRFTRPRSLAA